jgi:hypothetical protein
VNGVSTKGGRRKGNRARKEKNRKIKDIEGKEN